MALSAGDLAWIRSKVGDTPDDDDLNTRYARLESRADVAREVLEQRLANLLSRPLKFDVHGEYGEDQSGNADAISDMLTSDTTLYDDDDLAAGSFIRVIPPLRRAR